MAPDGSYRIVVYRISVFPMMMPGSAGDAPGFVRLYDRSDRILQEMDVEMVQLVDEVEWSEAAVHVKFLADWNLPRADR